MHRRACQSTRARASSFHGSRAHRKPPRHLTRDCICRVQRLQFQRHLPWLGKILAEGQRSVGYCFGNLQSVIVTVRLQELQRHMLSEHAAAYPAQALQCLPELRQPSRAWSREPTVGTAKTAGRRVIFASVGTVITGDTDFGCARI